MIHPQTKPRLDPPKNLPREKKAIWNRTVDAMPPGWFGPENEHLLRAPCCHMATADVLAAKLVPAREANDLERVDMLAAMHSRESKAVADLSTKMKLTPRSRMSQEKASHRQRLGSTTRPCEPKP
jgi:hypothetical protein